MWLSVWIERWKTRKITLKWKIKYDEAKRWQEKALEHSKDSNGTLLEHYGDILFKLGQTERAFEYWQKAKVAGKYSEFLDKKLLDKKMYE